MADFTMKDTEFRKWSPTWVDAGHNPVSAPTGAQITFNTDNPAILQLSFSPPAAHPELPTLNADGSEGIYVGSGSIGTANVTAVPGGTIASFATETASVEVEATSASATNMTFGDAATEES